MIGIWKPRLQKASEDFTLDQLDGYDEDIADLHLHFEAGLSGAELNVWRLYAGDVGLGEQISIEFNMVTPEGTHLDQTYD